MVKVDMPAQLIDGKALSAALREQVAQEVAALAAQHKPVKRVAILVGDKPAAQVYAENQERT